MKNTFKVKTLVNGDRYVKGWMVVDDVGGFIFGSSGEKYIAFYPTKPNSSPYKAVRAEVFLEPLKSKKK